jgi:DNA-binding response OmpR family regulator
MSRSFESVFEQHGYAVARVKSGARTIKLARRANPDVVVLEEGIGDLDALRVCSALGDDPLFDHTVPIVITSTAHVTSATRHAAYAAGAWEYCSHPVDLEALMLKLSTFRRARSETLARRGERLVDRESGLYTASGLLSLGEHCGAPAKRRHEPLACVALTLRTSDREVPGPIVSDEEHVDNFATVAELCRMQSRKSDIVAHVSESRLAILAPDTDAAGARLLVNRLRDALERSTDRTVDAGELELRAGYSAVADLAQAGVEPAELVRRASTALDHLQFADTGGSLMSFDELPSRRAD